MTTAVITRRAFGDIEARADASLKALINQRRWPTPNTASGDIATWSTARPIFALYPGSLNELRDRARP